jgi:hypothetical protein
MLDTASIATVFYGTPEYEIVRPGRFVLCAVSGERILLRDLKYWSATYQEAYRGAEESVAAALAGGAKNIKR